MTHTVQAHGRLSLSFHSCHEDPLGLAGVLDPEPDTSADFSSGWAAALPHLIQRRQESLFFLRSGRKIINNPFPFIEKIFTSELRPGLCGAEHLGLARRPSLESVSNLSQRSVSIRSAGFSWLTGSRKGSVDSNMSIQQTDLDRLQSIYDEAIKPAKKRSKREFFKSHRSRLRPWSRSRSRRGSVTGSDNSSVLSSISQVGMGILCHKNTRKKKIAEQI